MTSTWQAPFGRQKCHLGQALIWLALAPLLVLNGSETATYLVHVVYNTSITFVCAIIELCCGNAEQRLPNFFTNFSRPLLVLNCAEIATNLFGTPQHMLYCIIIVLRLFV